MEKQKAEKVIFVHDCGKIGFNGKPDSMGERKFLCVLEGWKDCFIFYYFDDELSFTTEELIGLTEGEVWELKSKKDRAYFQS